MPASDRMLVPSQAHCLQSWTLHLLIPSPFPFLCYYAIIHHSHLSCSHPSSLHMMSGCIIMFLTIMTTKHTKKALTKLSDPDPYYSHSWQMTIMRLVTRHSRFRHRLYTKFHTRESLACPCSLAPMTSSPPPAGQRNPPQHRSRYTAYWQTSENNFGIHQISPVYRRVF